MDLGQWFTRCTRDHSQLGDMVRSYGDLLQKYVDLRRQHEVTRALLDQLMTQLTELEKVLDGD